MTEIELDVDVPLVASTARITQAIEEAASAEELKTTLKGTLAKYPGCLHWHYKKGQERGTLEITWWPGKRRLWFKVAANRRAAWIDGVIPRLQQSIRSKI